MRAKRRQPKAALWPTTCADSKGAFISSIRIQTALPTRASIGDGPEPVDLAVIATKAATVPQIVRPRTKIMMNVANPENAFALSFIPNDGVGLAREEFIITSYIKAHPLALIDYANIRDASVRAEIDKLTAGHEDKAQFLVEQGIDSVSLNPDSVLATTLLILETERDQEKKHG